MDEPQYAAGDLLKSHRGGGLYAHYGVYFGRDVVLEFAGDHSKDVATARPRWSSLEKFADGFPVYVVGRSTSSQADLAERAHQVLRAPPRYNLFSYNCEHLARFVSTGERRSTQSDRVTLAGLVLGLIWLFGED